MMGKQKVRIKDIKTILSADQIATANSAKVTNEVEKRDGQVVKAPESQIDQSVAMSREMLNKLSKETETK